MKNIMFQMTRNWQLCVLTLVGLSVVDVSIVSGEVSVGKKALQSASSSAWNASYADPDSSEPVPYWFEAYNLLDPAQLLLFVGAQLLPATLNETFSTSLLPRLNPLDPKYVLKRCERADVAKCLTYGGPATGRPARLQGIFWMDGIAWPDEIICPPPAQWDPAARKVSLFTWHTQTWGFFDTNPRKDKSGLFYLPSGASFFNGGVYLGARYDVYYNEDVTVGQIIWVQRIFGIDFPVPTWLFNWTMEYQSDGSWKRTSHLFFNLINSATGSYTMRQIVDGSGNQTASFAGWLKARNGRPFYYPEEVPGSG